MHVPAHSARLDRATLLERDRVDPLARMRDAFDLPAGIIYLDGNSLGAMPRRAAEIATRVLEDEWAHQLIRSWNDAGWYDLPRRLGDKIARIIGAREGEVVMADSTSVNLFKVLNAALDLAPDRRVIVSERANFPTDLYVAEGIARLRARGHQLRLIDAPSELDAAIDADCAVVMLTHINYRDGAMHDMARVTRLAHERGALVVWDLAHSAGAVPLDVDACAADFAVGCTYKYLNGGPGAPAFVYVAQRWQPMCVQPLAGWWGHAAPFAFETRYRADAGIGAFLAGTPPVLSMAVAEAGIDLMLEAGLARLREKSVALTEAFTTLMRQECAGFGLELASAADPAARGSQVSFTHEHGHAIMQALGVRGVIGDYREPHILRFGFAPSYVRHVDVWDAVAVLREVLATRAWDDSRYREHRAVT